MFALVAALSSQATGAVVLNTDFTGRTVSGNTAGNITWTLNGVQDPGDLTAVDENGTGKLAGLFNTANAQGHFAPNLNIDNEGPWSVTIPLTLTAASVSLEDVVLDWQHFNNSGNFQGVSRDADWTVSVTGSSLGLLDSVTASNVGGSSGIQTFSFATPLSLTPAETYDVKVYVVGSQSTGNNTGLDAVTLNASVVVPEPATVLVWALLAAAGIAAGWWRRRR
jgi:hypothetical protein